jgi:hypothetical protein
MSMVTATVLSSRAVFSKISASQHVTIAVLTFLKSWEFDELWIRSERNEYKRKRVEKTR